VTLSIVCSGILDMGHFNVLTFVDYILDSRFAGILEGHTSLV